MAHVITLTLAYCDNAVVRNVFSNLEKAHEYCKTLGMTDSYMIVYRNIKRINSYMWTDGKYHYYLQKMKVQ
jgi:hypothetical protein